MSPLPKWLRCNSEGTLSSCEVIEGATNSEYTASFSDVSHRLRVREIAKNSGGESEPATSEPSAVINTFPVPGSTKAPEITGEARQEVQLKEVSGTWTNTPTEFKYQWLQCNSAGTLSSCASISGANSQTYTPSELDVGHALRVKETAKNIFGEGEAVSAATAEVLPQPPVLVPGKPPTISGEAKQGQILKEAHGEWTNHPTEYKVEWLQCEALGTACLPIGASGETYKLTSGDVGHAIRV